MSNYELALLLGSLVVLISALMFFGAATNRRNVTPSVFLFLIGGLTLYYAHTLNASGLQMGDLPGVVYKLIGRSI